MRGCSDIKRKNASHKVLDSVTEMLANPTSDHPLETEIAQELQENRKKFDKTAKQWTKKHAK